MQPAAAVAGSLGAPCKMAVMQHALLPLLVAVQRRTSRQVDRPERRETKNSQAVRMIALPQGAWRRPHEASRRSVHLRALAIDNPLHSLCLAVARA